METLEDFQLTVTTPIVNVASVRHLSPFRYPGGKTWLVPKLLSVLRNLPRKPSVFVDPFLGGGSIPLAALIEGDVDRAVLSEIDPAVASVWHTVFSPAYLELCERIRGFEITRDKVIETLSTPNSSTLDLAFKTIVRNRTFRGGILANGASLVKIGENGRGVASRWYPETLIKRIQVLNELADRVTFREVDGLKLLTEFVGDPDAFIFVDPPYTAGTGKRAGARLYDHNQVDHAAIFAALADGKADFLMTYDDDLEVLSMALRNNFVLQHVPMRNTHHRCMQELLISRT